MTTLKQSLNLDINMKEGEKYYLCCGGNVPYNVIVRNERGEFTCTYFGFILYIENFCEERKNSINTYAVIAEDSKFTSTLLKELILEKTLATEVIAVANGLELISEYSKLFIK
jgi:hypothetical protein